MTDVLSLASRRRLYEFLETHSGAHLREIGRRTDLPLGTALYHLDRLEAEGLVVVRRDGRYKRYFHAQGIGRREKDHLSAFRRAVPLRIADVLLDVGTATQRELCAALGVSRSTLSFHVNNMIGRGILRKERWRPENRYALADDETTRSVLERFRGSLDEEAECLPASHLLDGANLAKASTGV